jgi:hypothetical protein
MTAKRYDSVPSLDADEARWRMLVWAEGPDQSCVVRVTSCSRIGTRGVRLQVRSVLREGEPQTRLPVIPASSCDMECCGHHMGRNPPP